MYGVGSSDARGGVALGQTVDFARVRVVSGGAFGALEELWVVDEVAGVGVYSLEGIEGAFVAHAKSFGSKRGGVEEGSAADVDVGGCR